jgi:hypothetical protein
VGDNYSRHIDETCVARVDISWIKNVKRKLLSAYEMSRVRSHDVAVVKMSL